MYDNSTRSLPVDLDKAFETGKNCRIRYRYDDCHMLTGVLNSEAASGT